MAGRVPAFDAGGCGALTRALPAAADPAADLVQAADRDRWLATFYVPEALRPACFALHALDIELARVAATTTEAMLGQIRLAWWRERLDGLDRGEVPAQPVLQALAADVLPRGVTGRELSGFEDAWLPVLDSARMAPVDLADHVARRGASLFGALAAILGGERTDGAKLGRSWAAGETARRGLGLAGLDTPNARGRLRPLAGLAALGRRDVGRAASGLPPEPRATSGRQLVLLRATLIGR